jgi:ABC-type transport system involved in multi-copper enzyme maturation permease subunit
MAQAEVQGVEAVSEKEILDQLVEFARPIVEWMIGNRTPDNTEVEETETDEQAEAWASFLLDEQPALLSAVLLIMLYASPFLVALGSFNQFSGDVQSKGLRYQLLRSERSNIFFGRFIGAAIFAIIVMAVLIGIIALYLGLRTRLYPFGPLASWSLRGLLALAIVCIPYVALCSWISSTVDSPFGSLTLCILTIGIVPLFALLGRTIWEPVAYVNYALPWGVQQYLLHPNPVHLLAAVAACFGYTLVFLFLGYRHFLRRDL